MDSKNHYNRKTVTLEKKLHLAGVTLGKLVHIGHSEIRYVVTLGKSLPLVKTVTLGKTLHLKIRYIQKTVILGKVGKPLHSECRYV